MSRRRMLALAVTLSLIPAALAFGPAAAQDAAEPLGPPQAQPLTDPPDVPAGDGTGVRLSTDLGDIVVGLFNQSAPVAAENFVNLVEAGYYDGTGFHRIVPGFVIQGGDPEGTGRGGPGYTIADEPVVGRYGRGVVAMARTPEPNSQGSQFFVVLDDAAEAALESARTYTIFGRVIEGMDVVDAIAATPNSGPPENAALEPVIINSATIEQVELPPEPERAEQARPEEAAAADAALEALFPVAVAGVTLDPSSFTGEQLIAGTEADDPIRELTTIAEARDRSVSDFSIASASAGDGDALVGVLAATLEGVPAADFAAELTPVILRAGDDVEITDEVVAGRDVKRVGPGTGLVGDRDVYVLESGDVVWYVVAGDAVREEIISVLP